MVNVAAAVIENSNGEILITQRSKDDRLAFKWEFPGGKIEEGETAEECLKRAADIAEDAARTDGEAADHAELFDDPVAGEFVGRGDQHGALPSYSGRTLRPNACSRLRLPGPVRRPRERARRTGP